MHACVYSPDVSFCGYSIPHPSEKRINLRIQTHGETTPIFGKFLQIKCVYIHNYAHTLFIGVPAIDVLREGLEDLRDLYQHIHKTFQVPTKHVILS